MSWAELDIEREDGPGAAQIRKSAEGRVGKNRDSLNIETFSLFTSCAV